jgi:methionyl aminopeptidase
MPDEKHAGKLLVLGSVLAGTAFLAWKLRPVTLVSRSFSENFFGFDKTSGGSGESFLPKDGDRTVTIQTPEAIEKIRAACKSAASTLAAVGAYIRPGLTTDEINTFAHEDTVARGGWPAPLGYLGFPKSVCTAVNDQVCHGIPDDYVLQDGDIVSVDVTTILDGYHGDTAATFYVGEPSADAKKITEVARMATDAGIAQVRPGTPLCDIGAAIQEFVDSQHVTVVRDFVGHGIGKRFHEAPEIFHTGKWGRGCSLVPGMVFTIEPCVNLGGESVRVLPDDWTVVTEDGSLSAQFEHTILVTPDGCEVLTRI